MALLGIFARACPVFAWLLLCLLFGQIAQAADTAVSTLFVPETNTQISVNLPGDSSDDVNFYISAPDWYQYVAIGFGSDHANSLMLVAYPAADYNHITISPRFSTGNTEPIFAPEIKVTLNAGSGIKNQSIIANGTCHGCRSWATGSINARSTKQPMIFALGPNVGLSSDNPSALLRRHMGYGHFEVDMIKATGAAAGGLGVPTNITSGAVLVGDGLERDRNKAATAHGILFAIVALAVAPFDTLVAGALKRWPTLHAISSSLYFAMVIGALVPGIMISKEHILTQKFSTGHQVLGLITIVIMFGMVLWGIALMVIKKSAKKRGQEPPESSGLMSKVHTWVGRLVWLLFLINNGLGLKLSEQTMMFVLGYAVLAAGVVIFLLPVYFCIWRCTRKPKPKDEDSFELHDTIYNQNPNGYR
ncbi:hypothetical protein B0H63DRAFT_464225 [Podospora didyma]|uniref:DOMON domain-containing protein n=1 Tax=Podospora didyma TaxID=330526 RepID=A0AAE0U3Z0_9PEZI|nr:hypothetical protein B0H63DRAFT_464225 [Podospora didyma]